MNKLHKLLHKYEKRLKYLLIAIGILFIFIGMSIDWLKAWLIALGDSYAKDGHCFPCRIYAGFVLSRPLFIIIGSSLSFPLLFEKQIIKLYEKCEIKLKILLPILFILILITLSLIAYFPFHNYPYCLDEYNYLYQAKIFSQGKLYIEIPEIYRPFKETYMILKDNKLFSKYPPGFPLLLSIGVLLNITGLINPLIATMTLILLCLLVKSFLRPRDGFLSVILMSTTPYFLSYSASYFSHPTALFLTTLIFYILRKYELTSNSKYLFWLGFVSGYSILTRPLDSFCVLVPSSLYLLYILYKRNDLKKASYFILPLTSVFICFLIYNYILVGKISIATYPVVTGEFRIVDPKTVGFFDNLTSISRSYIQNGFEYLPKSLFLYLFVPTALFVPFFAIIGVFKFKSRWKWIIVLNILMLIFLYNFHCGFGWPQYGSRYYYSGFTSWVVLATVGFRYTCEKISNKKHIFYLLSLILFVHVLFSFIAIREYSYRFESKIAIIDDIKVKCDNNSIVFLDIDWGKIGQFNSFRRISRMDLGGEKRNMFMNPSRLITVNNGDLKVYNIRSNFPNHSVCFYKYDVINELVPFFDRSEE